MSTDTKTHSYCDWCQRKTPFAELRREQRGFFCSECETRSPRQVHQTSTFDPNNPWD